MRNIIGVTVLVTALIGTSLLFGQQIPSSASSGRWQVVAGPKQTILLDSSSGETWLFQTTVKAGTGEITEQAWKPIMRSAPATQPTNGR